MIDYVQISLVNLWNQISKIQESAKEGHKIECSSLQEKIKVISVLLFQTLDSAFFSNKNNIINAFRIDLTSLEMNSHAEKLLELAKEKILSINIGVEILSLPGTVNFSGTCLEDARSFTILISWISRLDLSASFQVATYLKVVKRNILTQSQQGELFKTLLNREDVKSLNFKERISLLANTSNLASLLHADLISFIFSDPFMKSGDFANEHAIINSDNKDIYFLLLKECLKANVYEKVRKLIDYKYFERMSLHDFENVVPEIILKFKFVDMFGWEGFSQKILNHSKFKSISSQSLLKCFEGFIISLYHYKIFNEIHEVPRMSEALLVCDQFRNISCEDKQRLYLGCQRRYKIDFNFLVYLFDFQSLANYDWSTGIPNIINEKQLWKRSNINCCPPRNQLMSLKKIVAQLKNPSCIDIVSPTLIKAIIIKCRPSAKIISGQYLKDAYEVNRSVFELYSHYPQFFSREEIEAEELSRGIFSIQFESGNSLEFPLYFKEVLAVKSDYFKLLFSSHFKEANSKVINLEKIPINVFKKIVKYCEEGPQTLKKMPFNCLVDLAGHAQYLCINELIGDLDYTFRDRIEGLDTKCLISFLKVISFVTIDFNMSDRLEDILDSFLRNFLKKSVSVDFLFPIFFNNLTIPAFTIENSTLSNKDMKNLHTNFIKELRVIKCRKITSEGFSSMSKAMSFESLEVDSCPMIDDEFLAYFSNMQLKALKVSGCKKFQGAGLQFITRMPIQLLNCSFCNIGDGALIYIKELLSLERLDISGNNELTDIALRELNSHPTLKSLSLNYCPNITSVGMYNLENTALKYLSVSHCQHFKDSALPYLANMPLEVLDLSYTGITD
nr:BTB/POZ domain-containing protein [Parachlamydiaceae bacterium]